MSDRPTTDARDRALAAGRDGGLGGTYLVEAGAGTGKTTVLVDRLVALVASGVKLERIVAITFTEKAAGELRLRLRAGLEKAFVDTRDEDGRDPHDRGRAERMREALACLDRAQVATIHGFCSALLRERPVEAGIDPGFAVADKLRQTVIEETVWDEWIRGQLAKELPPAVAEAHALGFRLRQIRELAGKLLNHRDALGDVPEALADTGGDALLAKLARTADDFQARGRDHCSAIDDKLLPRLAEFAEAIRALADLPEEMRLAHALSHVKTPPLNSGRKSDWTGDTLAELREDIRGLRESIEAVEKAVRHNAAVRVVEWLDGFVKAYQREKTARGLLDFQDMLTLARDLLRDRPDVRRHFKRSFDRILLDEFQDTDPLQCEIAFFLAEREEDNARVWDEVILEPGKLFVVGDPKQSIYRFRRADIETYEKARELIRKVGGVLELVENFRTRPAIIEGVNTVFEPLMQPPAEGERRYQPDYAALTAFRPPDDYGAGTVLLDLTGELPENAKVGQVRALEARAVAGFLKEMRESGDYRIFDRTLDAWRAPELKDVAILFRTMTSLDDYEDALARYEIDYRIAGGKRFYIRSEVLELITVLSSIEDPHNAAAVVGALRSPFFGISDDDIVIHRLKAGSLSYLDDTGGVPVVRDSLDILRELHIDRESDRIASLIERLFDHTKAPELFLLKPSGEQRHANLMKVTELADALERTEHVSFGGFVRWLRETVQLAPEESESPLSEEGDDFVRLMTVHKAKGLEFPITILADLSSYSTRKEEIIVDRIRERMDFGFGSKDSAFGTDEYEDARKIEDRRREAEVTRLLYVAATRARDLVVIPWVEPDGPVSARGLLPRLDPLTTLESYRADADGGRPRSSDVSRLCSKELDPGEANRAPGRLRAADILEAANASNAGADAREAWRIEMAHLLESAHRPLAISRPSAGDYDRSLSGSLRDDPARPDLAFGGTAFGTLVHDIFDAVGFDASSTGDAAARGTVARSAAHEVVARSAAALASAVGLGEGAADAAAGLVARGLATDVMRRAASAERHWKEVPVVTRVDDGLVEGTIDLLFEDDGGLVIVDYKTNIPGEGGVAALTAHYTPQMKDYAEAVRRSTGRRVVRAVLLFLRGTADGSAVESDVPL